MHSKAIYNSVVLYRLIPGNLLWSITWSTSAQCGLNLACVPGSQQSIPRKSYNQTGTIHHQKIQQVWRNAYGLQQDLCISYLSKLTSVTQVVFVNSNRTHPTPLQSHLAQYSFTREDS